MNISELYKVSMTPHHVEVPPKTAFKLTCTIHDNDVKGWIVWKSKRSGADYPKYNTVERHGYSNIEGMWQVCFLKLIHYKVFIDGKRFEI